MLSLSECDRGVVVWNSLFTILVTIGVESLVMLGVLGEIKSIHGKKLLFICKEYPVVASK